MRFGNWIGKRYSVLGVLAVGALAFGLRLEGAPASGPARDKAVITAETSQELVPAVERRFKIGKVPTSYKIMPTITADWRDDEPTRLRAAGLLKGPMPLFHRPAGGIAATGDACSFDIECDDGDPCTDDFCDIAPGQPQLAGVCNNEIVANGEPGDTNGPDCDDGLACNGEETCQGATVNACEGTCNGGGNDGDSCIRETDCPGGGTCENQQCPGGAPCIDNSECGSAVGTCQPGTPIDCSGDPNTVCDENADPIAACVTKCNDDAFCADELDCNGVEVCDVGTGLCRSPGNPCGSSGAVCLEQQCIAGGPGVVGNFCAADVDCTGAAGSCGDAGPYCKNGRCCFDGSRVIPNPSFETCSGIVGDWYAGDNGSLFGADNVPCPLYAAGVGDEGTYYVTAGPASISPIVDAITDDFLVKLGDDYDTGETSFIDLEHLRFTGGVSSGNSRIAFEFYDENGNFVEDVFFPSNNTTDEIQVVNVFSLAPTLVIPPRGYLVGHVLQNFAGNSSQRGEFFWMSTDSGECAVDGTCTAGPNTGSPCCGDAACGFGGVCTGATASCGASCTSDGDCTGTCSTTVVDAGTNDPSILFVAKGRTCSGGANDGAACLVANDCPGGTCVLGNPSVVANYLTVCNGGTRDGLACDSGAPGDSLPDCPGGSCDSVPGVLAFELEGTTGASPPFGGCCDPSDPTVCNEQLQWLCFAAGGNYLGDAIPCASCNDVSPNVGAACRTCTDGANDGDACVSADDCPDGTCDTNDLFCRVCEGDFTTPCTSDGDCAGPGGPCSPGACELSNQCGVGACCVPDAGPPAINDCEVNHTPGSCATAGGTWQGLGTDCEPDCCVQPTLTGDDDCETAPVTLLEVPAGGVCQHGTSKGSPCLSSADCGGEACERTIIKTLTGNNSTASSTVANPDSCNAPSDVPGGDLGWFEAFQIYDPAIRPDDTIACGYLLVDHCCTDPLKIPAYRILYNACPCGATEFTKPNPNHPTEEADARGKPYCTFDNAWQRFGPMAGANNPTEVAAGVGTYYYPILSTLAGNLEQYQFHVRVEACPDAVCCVTTCSTAGTGCQIDADCPGGETCEPECKLVNQLECASLGGAFLAPPNVGTAVNICNNDPVSGTCATGSCCTGPGECLDTQDPAQSSQIDVDYDWCVGEGGRYAGGIRCRGGVCSDGERVGQSCRLGLECPNGSCLGDALDLSQPLPCPICEIQGPKNCQVFDDSVASRDSDRGMPGGGTQMADDFKPLDPTIDKVCAWGYYTDGSNGGVDCADAYTDSFRVVIYESDANGMPDVNTAVTREVPVEDVLRVEVQNSAFFLLQNVRVFGYQLDLTSQAITGLDTSGDTCYWVEISNESTDGLCGWSWMAIDAANNDFSALGSAGAFGVASPRNGDMAFCLSGAFEEGACGTPLGYCCACDGSCANETLRDCLGQIGQWRVDDVCGGAIDCLPGAPLNDLCTSVIEPGFPDTPEGVGLYDNSCALSDGVNPVDSDFGAGENVAKDLWYKYIATCEGQLTISTCASGTAGAGGLDTIVLAYKDSVDPFTCICPSEGTDHDQAVAWYTEPSQSGGAVHAADENCNGVADAGGGIIQGLVSPGHCVMIRAGAFAGQGSETGQGVVSILCEAPDAPPPVTPEGDGGNRYISVSAGGDPLDQALRVKFIALDGYPIPGQDYLYVGAPFQAPEEDASQPGLTFTAAPLSCDPYFHNWTGEGTISVFGAEIMPGSTYEVQRAGLNCGNLADETCWSDVDAQSVTLKYGDVTALFDGDDPNAPQPDFNDIAAVVEKFLAAPGAPIKAVCQLQPNVVFPTRAIDFKDVAADVQGFLGTPYNSSNFGPCTCPASVTCGATACANDLACVGNGDGLCVGGFCADKCGRCAP